MCMTKFASIYKIFEDIVKIWFGKDISVFFLTINKGKLTLRWIYYHVYEIKFVSTDNENVITKAIEFFAKYKPISFSCYKVK